MYVWQKTQEGSSFVRTVYPKGRRRTSKRTRQYHNEPRAANGSQMSPHNDIHRTTLDRRSLSDRVKKKVRKSARQPAAIIAIGVRKASCGR